MIFIQTFRSSEKKLASWVPGISSVPRAIQLLFQMNNLLVLTDLFLSEIVTKELASLRLETIYKALKEVSRTVAEKYFATSFRELMKTKVYSYQ